MRHLSILLLSALATAIELDHHRVGKVYFAGLTYKPFDELTSAPFPWEPLNDRPVPPDARLTLHMPLAHADQDAYEHRFLTSHDPDDSDYGKAISAEEMDHALGPTNETFETVLGWLRVFGIAEDAIDLDMDWLSFETTVEKAQELLKAEYRWWINRRVGQVTLRCLSYSLPKEVEGMVRFVQPTTLFATRVRGRRGM